VFDTTHTAYRDRPRGRDPAGARSAARERSRARREEAGARVEHLQKSTESCGRLGLVHDQRQSRGLYSCGPLPGMSNALRLRMSDRPEEKPEPLQARLRQAIERVDALRSEAFELPPAAVQHERARRRLRDRGGDVVEAARVVDAVGPTYHEGVSGPPSKRSRSICYAPPPRGRIWMRSYGVG
jgi:hypothetical protein